MNTEPTNETRNQVEKETNIYIEANLPELERLLRHAFLEGYGQGLDAAKRIYNSSRTASDIKP